MTRWWLAQGQTHVGLLPVSYHAYSCCRRRRSSGSRGGLENPGREGGGASSRTKTLSVVPSLMLERCIACRCGRRGLFLTRGRVDNSGRVMLPSLVQKRCCGGGQSSGHGVVRPVEDPVNPVHQHHH
ncbi:unnamed protein product, partial [Ectocarpus sp. 12 AP-2014]